MLPALAKYPITFSWLNMVFMHTGMNKTIPSNCRKSHEFKCMNHVAKDKTKLTISC